MTRSLLTMPHAWLLAMRRAHARIRASGDGGTTMIEIFVAMILMSIAGSIFVGAVVTLNRTTNQAQAITNSAAQNNQAYQALDKIVRYASAISTPGRSTGTGATGDWYVELQDTTGGSELCIQLRVDIATQRLEKRTWTPGGPLGDWTQIASPVHNGGAAAGSSDQPFVLGTPTGSQRHQALTITTVSRSGPANGRVSSRSSYTLTALNSTLEPPATFCQQAGRP